MCFGGGGGGGGTTQAPTFNFPTIVNPQEVKPPQPVSRTYKPLIDEFTSAAVRQAGTAKKRNQKGTVRRQSLSTGTSIASGGGSPAGGINL